MDESYHELIWSAFERIGEGWFTLAEATNAYLAIATRESLRSSLAGRWDKFLPTVRNVLRMWP